MDEAPESATAAFHITIRFLASTAVAWMLSLVFLSVPLRLRMQNLQDDLAGLVRCAREHALRLARL